MSCISSHAGHLRGCFSRKLEEAKHPISRRSGNCVFFVQEGAHFNKENRSNIRFDVSWCRYINAYVGCRGTSVWLGPAFSPSLLFPRTWISAIRVHDDQFTVRTSRTRWCLGMSERGETFSQTFFTFDASVSERPLTELRDFPSCSAVFRPSPPYSLAHSLFLISECQEGGRGTERVRDVEAGESERLYRPATGPVKRREPGGFGKLRFLFDVTNNGEYEKSKLLKNFILVEQIFDALEYVNAKFQRAQEFYCSRRELFKIVLKSNWIVLYA